MPVARRQLRPSVARLRWDGGVPPPFHLSGISHCWRHSKTGGWRSPGFWSACRHCDGIVAMCQAHVAAHGSRLDPKVFHSLEWAAGGVTLTREVTSGTQHNTDDMRKNV